MYHYILTHLTSVYTVVTVFRIRDILVRIRIRIYVLLNTDPDTALFVSDF